MQWNLQNLIVIHYINTYLARYQALLWVAGTRFLGMPWWSRGQASMLLLLGDTGSIPGQGTEIPHAMWHTQTATTTNQDSYPQETHVLTIRQRTF